jgi:hypothetical protein
MRRTLRTSLRTGETRSGSRAGVGASCRAGSCLLCDISGSMEPYARAYLQFLTCAAGGHQDAEAFVFATRLTRLTRALSSRNPERAIARAAAAAPDWSSGTRIGDALKAFNDRRGRRGMARGAVIVILSDGWERGDPVLVGREMERLARLAHRIVWVNPRVSAGGFSVQAGGMVAALPHCDALVSGYSLEALGEVVDAIAAESRDRPRPVAVSAEPTAEPEPWASATPVAGSSVAMPTGKMVLSLTTESDGREPQYAQLVAAELGIPALDVKVVPADTDRFGVGHGYNTRPSDGTSAAIASAVGKIRAKAQLLAGTALEASPDTLEWSGGAWVKAGGSDPTQVKTIEEIAMYAHGTGALPRGVEGGLDAQTVYRD